MLPNIRLVFVSFSLMLIAVSIWRWHDRAVAAPMLLDRSASPGFLLVVNERDCVASRNWLIDWVEPILERGIPVRAAIIRSGAEAPEEVDLGSGIRLDRVELPSERRVEVALLRAGVRSTPALVLLNERGGAALVEPLFEMPRASAAALPRTLGDLYFDRTSSSTTLRGQS